MKEFEPLIGEWRRGRDPGGTSDDDLRGVEDRAPGRFIVLRSAGEPAVVPDIVSIIGGAPDGEDRNGPDGPGFNQRFIGEISDDGRTIKGRWERGMGDAGEEWEIDFPIDYVRK